MTPPPSDSDAATEPESRETRRDWIIAIVCLAVILWVFYKFLLWLVRT